MMRIIYENLPTTVKAVTVMEDDFYNIIVNRNISYEEQQKAIAHEYYHIRNNDFFECDVDMVEIKAHGY